MSPGGAPPRPVNGAGWNNGRGKGGEVRRRGDRGEAASYYNDTSANDTPNVVTPSYMQNIGKPVAAAPVASQGMFTVGGTLGT